MPTGKPALLLVLLLALLSLLQGCLSVTFGQVSYDGSLLKVQVYERGDPEDAALQVNVFQFQNFRQLEVTREIVPVRLEKGWGTYSLPLTLARGNYRLYLYITRGNERRASVIREITVETHGATPRIGAG